MGKIILLFLISLSLVCSANAHEEHKKVSSFEAMEVSALNDTADAILEALGEMTKDECEEVVERHQLRLNNLGQSLINLDLVKKDNYNEKNPSSAISLKITNLNIAICN